MIIGASRHVLSGLAAAFFCACSLGLSGQALADALIVAAKGNIEPPVEEFSEAADGDTFVLAQDAELIILHYGACVEAHFRGGAVTIRPEGFEHAGAQIGETRVECPRKVAFAEDTNAVAAVILRGDPPQTVINVRPVFVLLGDGVDHVEISQGDTVIRRLALGGGRLARWPADAAPLAVGESYKFAVVSANGTRMAPAVAATVAGVTVVEP